jgi:hypothetical protein
MSKIDRAILEGAVTAHRLAEALLEGPDVPVVFVCDYGDYHHTEQALPVGNHEELDPTVQRLVESGYSNSGVALHTDEYPSDEPYKDEDVVNVIILRS